MKRGKTHRWAPPERPSEFLSIYRCLKCPVEKHSRHEPSAPSVKDQHWTEYWRNGAKLPCHWTPVCEPVEVSA